MENLISDEVKELIHNLKNIIEENDQVEIMHIFNLPIINSLWKIISSKRLDIRNPDEKRKMENLAEIFATFGVFGVTKVLAYKLPFWIGKKIPLMQKYRNLFTNLLTWFQNEYIEHEKTLDPDSPRDFLDAYICERNKANEQQNEKSSFFGENGEANFGMSMADLFLAGSETTSTSLTWAILYMLENPEPFKKAQVELNQVVGTSRLPEYSDRPNLPYFEALLAELMRKANVAPFAIFHINEEESYISGFRYNIF